MIHARLIVLGRENGVSLSIINVATFTQTDKLPANEAVVKGIHIGRDEGTAPIRLI